MSKGEELRELKTIWNTHTTTPLPESSGEIRALGRPILTAWSCHRTALRSTSLLGLSLCVEVHGSMIAARRARQVVLDLVKVSNRNNWRHAWPRQSSVALISSFATPSRFYTCSTGSVVGLYMVFKVLTMAPLWRPCRSSCVAFHTFALFCAEE